MFKISGLKAFLLLIVLGAQGCKQGKDICDCPIEHAKDRFLSKDNQIKKDSVIMPDIKINAQIDKILRVNSNFQASRVKTDVSVKDIYEEVLVSNPGITQKVNLFREVACACYKFTCEDNTISKLDKKMKLEGILNEYKLNVYDLIKNDTLRDTVVTNDKEKVSVHDVIKRSGFQSNTINETIYRTRLIDLNGNSISGATVYCSNCITEKVITDHEGTILLRARFSEQEQHWVSILDIHFGNKRDSRQINWREGSPESIIF